MVGVVGVVTRGWVTDDDDGGDNDDDVTVMPFPMTFDIMGGDDDSDDDDDAARMDGRGTGVNLNVFF